MASPAPASASSVWTEYKNPEGRLYWYHAVEKRSVWEKPVELKTPRERAIDSTKWKEYTSGERKYYVHSETKESSWHVPAELKELFAKIPDDTAATPPPAAATSAAATGPGPAAGTASPSVPPPAGSPAGATAAGGSAGGVSPSSGVAYTGPPAFPGAPPARPPIRPPSGPALMGSAPPSGPAFMGDPVFADRDEAERAFISLLKMKGIDSSWTWEATMRAIITEPLYKALKTLSERKAAFQRYVDELRQRDQEERARRRETLRPQLAQVFKKDPRLKSYTSFETVKKFLQNSPIWKEFRSVEEAREVYETVIQDLRDADKAREVEVRHRNMDMMMSLLRTFETDVLTRWRDVHRTVIESDEYRTDAHMKEMEVVDMLDVFDEHMRSVEKETLAEQKKDVATKKRNERKRRTAFKELLHEHRQKGHIKPRTSWTAFYPRIQDDQRFRDVLLSSGSTPLELFCDVVDELEQREEDVIKRTEQALKEQQFDISEATTLTDVKASLTGVIDDADLEAAFDELKAQVLKRATDERRRAERRLRHQVDDLRYALKKLDPPLGLEDDDGGDQSFETALPAISQLREFQELQDEPSRRYAWDKHVARQKEKLEERREIAKREADHASRKRSAPDDDRRDRDRDREQRRTSRRGGGEDASSDRHSGRRDRDRQRDRDEPGSSGAREVGAANGHLAPPSSKRSKKTADSSDVEEGQI